MESNAEGLLMLVAIVEREMLATGVEDCRGQEVADKLLVAEKL